MPTMTDMASIATKKIASCLSRENLVPNINPPMPVVMTASPVIELPDNPPKKDSAEIADEDVDGRLEAVPLTSGTTSITTGALMLPDWVNATIV